MAWSFKHEIDFRLARHPVREKFWGALSRAAPSLLGRGIQPRAIANQLNSLVYEADNSSIEALTSKLLELRP